MFPMVKRKISYLLSHPLISGSTIVFIGSFIANIFNYFFNLAMGRLLSVPDYGLLITLSSFLVIFGIVNTALANIFSRFSARYHAKKDKAGVSNLLTHGSRVIGVGIAVLLIVLLVFTGVIKSFLHIDNYFFLILMYLSIGFLLFFSIPFGILQGQMRFYLLSGISGISPVAKLVIGVLLVYGFNMAVFGAVLGVFASMMVSTIFTYIYVYLVYFQKKKKKNDVKDREFLNEFGKYGFGLFLTSVALALISNLDIILVRHFFDEYVVGQYAALSLMGKAIFYLTSPVNFVFFPLMAYKKERGERLLSTVLLGVSGIAVMSFAVSAFYFVFPDIILKIFFPAKEYLTLKNMLGPFSLYIVAFSVTSILVNLFLSIGKTKIYKILFFGVGLEVALILGFHDSLWQVILSMILVSFLIMLILLVYYAKYERS